MDKGRQFWCRSFKAWCKRRNIRPRYGRIGEPASIAIVERFIRSMKSECTRLVLVPLSLEAMRRELRFYASWYNQWRTHMALAGKTPRDVYDGRSAVRRRIEPRPRWPHRPRLLRSILFDMDPRNTVKSRLSTRWQSAGSLHDGRRLPTNASHTRVESYLCARIQDSNESQASSGALYAMKRSMCAKSSRTSSGG